MKFLKSLITALMVVTMLSGCFSKEFSGVEYENSNNVKRTVAISKTYSSFNEIKTEVASIFAAEKASIAADIKTAYPSLSSYSDDMIFVMSNCGPSSIRFQKKLIGNDILAEVRTNEGYTKYHEYNLYRAVMTDGTIKNVIIDTTYKQFFTQYINNYISENNLSVSANDVLTSAEFKAIVSDDILILESADELQAYYTNLFNALDNSQFQSSYNYSYFLNNLQGTYELNRIPEPDLQKLYSSSLTTTEMETLTNYANERFAEEDVLIIYYRSFETASTYTLHAYNGLSQDVTMDFDYDFYTAGGSGNAWYKVTLYNVPASFSFCFVNSNGNWDGVDRTYNSPLKVISVEANDSTVTAKKAVSEKVTIYYKEFEYADSYSIHCWGDFTQDIQMTYDGYYEGAHWWKAEVDSDWQLFNFCFFNSNGNWDGTDRVHNGSQSSIYTAPYSSVLNDMYF